MKLTFEQLKAITKGAMEIRKNADGSAFLRRFTEAQRALYPIHSPKHAPRCEYSTNISFDFYTDADCVTLTLEGVRIKQYPNLPVDLLVDNVPVWSNVRMFASEETSGYVPFDRETFRFDLPGKWCRVTLQLHYRASANSVTLELPDGAALEPYTHAKTLVAFGDSITHGSSALHPSASYISRLGRMLDAQVHNFSIGGERFEPWKIVPGTYPKCDLVTVAYGTNDFGHADGSKEMFGQKMPAFLMSVTEEFPNVPIFVLLPIWRAAENKPHNDIPCLQYVRDAISREAEKYPNITVIDCQDFVPHDPANFTDARLHPNDNGMQFFANALYAAIQDKL